DTFGPSNGAGSYGALQAAIARLRPNDSVGPATNIGCRILVQPVFLPEYLWRTLPPTWSPNIMGGKRFSTDDADGLALWNDLHDAAGHWQGAGASGLTDVGARFGNPTLITPRLGQGAFRIAVTEAYHRQCAVSGGKVLPALDAAHIRPYADGGAH